MTALRLMVDGRAHEVDEDLGAESLLRVLRDELGLMAPRTPASRASAARAR